MSPCLTLSPFLVSLPEDNPGGRATAIASQFHAVGFPELQAGQYAVCSLGISEISVDLQSDLGPANSDSPAWVFHTFSAARAFALQAVVYYPLQQCLIFDANWQHVHTVQNGQPIPLEELLARHPKTPKTWWQIWK